MAPDGDVLNVWCDDVGVRRRALLERVDFDLSYQARPDLADTEAFIGRVATLLNLGAVGLPELRQMAIDEAKGAWLLSWPASAKESTRPLTGYRKSRSVELQMCNLTQSWVADMNLSSLELDLRTARHPDSG